jgi:hypothetical protein
MRKFLTLRGNGSGLNGGLTNKRTPMNTAGFIHFIFPRSSLGILVNGGTPLFVDVLGPVCEYAREQTTFLQIRTC